MARRAPAREAATKPTDDPNTGKNDQDAADEAARAAAAQGAGSAAGAANAPKGDDEGNDDDEEDDKHTAMIDGMISDDVAKQLKIVDPVKRRLLAEACLIFGIDPDPRKKPLELAGFRFDAGEPDGPNPVPASVSVVTSGGLKIRYPMDSDTETRLRLAFGAFVVEKGSGERKELPLPDDLTLPRSNVDGVVRTNEHQYRPGYLRSGGKSEADRRETVSALRWKALGQ